MSDKKQNFFYPFYYPEKTYKHFLAFEQACKNNERCLWYGPNMVMLDRVSYDELQKKAGKANSDGLKFSGVIFDEFAGKP